MTTYIDPYRPKILLLDMGMWGMYSGIKANKKHDGADEKTKIIRQPLIDPFTFVYGHVWYVLLYI